MAYRVAVIENESESLRYGYANVFQRLQQLKRLRNYVFERFDSRNVGLLFDGDLLLSFDSLFISTNATSDSATLAVLRSNQDKIESFITAGKGVFISNQKKLAASQSVHEDDLSSAGFLPPELEVAVIERPEPSSADGSITTSLESNSLFTTPDIILDYPEAVRSDEMLQTCRENDFKVHLYRAYLRPIIENSYHVLVYDKSYGDSVRPLVIISRQAVAERVVISTIALDWEWHSKLLTNIVVFISEGFPTVAFVSGVNRPTGDFDYLVSSAALSKIPHSLYHSVESIPHRLLNIHGIYVLSPECSEKEVADLWGSLSSRNQSRYSRLYRLRKEAHSLSLVQYTNYSSIDVAVDAAVSWLDVQYKSGMWSGGFWNTFDVLSMMCELEIDASSYLPGVFSELLVHFKNGSYDGVLGATCGLLELSVRLTAINAEVMSKNGLTAHRMQQTALWIMEASTTQSLSGRQSAILTLSKYAKWIHKTMPEWPHTHQYDSLLIAARRDISGIGSIALSSGYSELDIIRLIKVAVLVSSPDEDIETLFKALQKLQQDDGSWRSTGRTAYIVIGLMECYKALAKAMVSDTELNEVIYNAILHLRSTYDETTGSWGKDIQATAKAAQAIGMHNKLFAYSTQDFFETIRREVRQVDRSEGIREMRRELAELRKRAKTSGEQARSASQQMETAVRCVDTLRLEQHRIARHETSWRVVAVTSSFLLTGLIVSLVIHQREAAVSLFSEIGSLLPLIISAVLAVPITLAMKPSKVIVHRMMGTESADRIANHSEKQG
jgi:hypothetical protein